MVRTLVLLTTLFIGIGPVFGQKIKYKDLFILLNAKQFDEAEPFLRKYLKENDDNPNAHLFMGMIFQEKASGNDILKETDILNTNLDSAIYFYDLTFKGVTEKELRKNDEYYQAYNRRDLRTGKFGVKLSDVQFDLEKRQEALKEKKVLAIQLRKQFEETDALYAKTQFLYKDLKIRFNANQKALLLRANDSLIMNLKRIAITFDSCNSSFDSYKGTLQKMGKTNYNQVIDLKEIETFSTDGEGLLDFYQNDLKFWGYKTWSENIIKSIQEDVIPMRDRLVASDIEINKLRERLTKDSVSVKAEISTIRAKNQYAELKKFDPSPMPLSLFDMKLAELDYLSELVSHKPFKDSADLHFRTSMIKTEIVELNKLDSISGKLADRDFKEESKDYNHFVTNAYGTTAVLRSLVNATKDFAVRELSAKQEEISSLTESLKWIVTEADSIPLFIEVSESSKFAPLVIMEEQYTAGLRYTDSLAVGYFHTIIPSRRNDVSISFPVDQKNFVRRKASTIKALSSSDENGQVFYTLIFSEELVEDTFPVTLTKIYRTDGLAWSSNLMLPVIPSELTFNVESGQVSIKMSNAAGESVLVAVDKNGKQIVAAN